jgi:hypothetical protein
VNDPEITRENDDPYVSELNCLSMHKLEALLKNKYTPETILFIALDNIRTIGRGSVKGTNTEDEINLIANCIVNNPHSSDKVLEYILEVLAREKVSWDEELGNNQRLHRFLVNSDKSNAAASSNNLSVEFIRQLARDDDFDVRLNIAQRPDLPEDVINLLASDAENNVRAAIMDCSKDLTEDLIRKLANPRMPSIDRSPTYYDSVDYKLAILDFLPTDVAIKLSLNKCPNVRLVLAERENLPPDAVSNLLKDPDEDVRSSIESRFDLLSAHPDWNIRWKCANNYHCPIEILAILSKDISVEVRHCIARRRYLPETIRDLLITDSDSEVSRSAKENILSPPP